MAARPRPRWCGWPGGTASAWSGRTASACSTPTRPYGWPRPSRRSCRRWAGWRWRRSRARSASPCSTTPPAPGPACRASSRWATRPTSAATTCCRTGSTTRRRPRSRSTWSRSATRAGSPGSPGRWPAASPCSPSRAGGRWPASGPAPRTRPPRPRPTWRWTTLFAQAGIVRADHLGDLLDAARMLTDQPLPAGDRIAVLGNAGGVNVLAADAAEPAGLRVPELSADLLDRLGPGAGNPFDLGAGATVEAFAHSLEAIADSGEVDAVVVIVAGHPGQRRARRARGAGPGHRPAPPTCPSRSSCSARTVRRASVGAGPRCSTCRSGPSRRSARPPATPPGGGSRSAERPSCPACRRRRPGGSSRRRCRPAAVGSLPAHRRASSATTASRCWRRPPRPARRPWWRPRRGSATRS